MNEELAKRLTEAARADVLLVACDYDGTLAPIVPDPAEARPLAECIRALGALAGLERTRAAIVSGRAVESLTKLVELPASVMMVGCHGAEMVGDLAHGWSEPPDDAELEAVAAELERIAKWSKGFRVERKPFGAALHYRGVDAAIARDAVTEVAALAARVRGASLRRGVMVVEVMMTAMNKGAALLALRRRTGASAVVFIGDDLTDEDAFAVLTASDVGIKVGGGATVARHGVKEVADVAKVLARLLVERGQALAE